MTVEQKRIKREPAEIKKLFILMLVATQINFGWRNYLHNLMEDYGIEAKCVLVEVDTAYRTFLRRRWMVLNEDKLVERPPVVTIMGHAMVNKPCHPTYSAKSLVAYWCLPDQENAGKEPPS